MTVTITPVGLLITLAVCLLLALIVLAIRALNAIQAQLNTIVPRAEFEAHVRGLHEARNGQMQTLFDSLAKHHEATTAQLTDLAKIMAANNRLLVPAALLQQRAAADPGPGEREAEYDRHMANMAADFGVDLRDVAREGVPVE